MKLTTTMSKSLTSLKELSQQLTALKTEKERVKLLFKAIEANNTTPNTDDNVCLIAFASGYLSSLLVKHGLNDWR